MSDRKRLSSLSIALIVSLVANALLLGFLVGGQIGERDHRRHGPRGADHMIARGIQSIVPDEEREGIRDAFRDAFRSASGSWQEKRQARDDLVAALSSSRFDPAEVDRAFLAMRTADASLNETFQTTLSDQIAALSAEQRAELVAWLEEVEAKRAEARAERFERRGEREGRDGPPPR